MNRNRRHRGLALVAGAAAGVLAVAGCTATPEEGDRVTITLSGPNQWTDDPDTFGDAWEGLIERFEADEPGIKVETVVLPISEFAQTLSTQLAAGTAPELIFSQVPHTPEQVVALDDYLEEPNPYVEGNERWIDIFNHDYFGPDTPTVRNAAGNFDWIPLNMIIVGIYYNADAFDEAGIDAPIETYGDLMDACEALDEAGYIPFAMDSSPTAAHWLLTALHSMLADKHFDDWNTYDASGEPGEATRLTTKSMAHAVLTGSMSPRETPEIAEALELLKGVYDTCATPNWSGIPAGGAFIGAEDFESGRAAMALGSNFSATRLADADWDFGTMPFPTVSEDDSDLSTGIPARFGISPGATNYMIPATTEGPELEAAIKFLQYASSVEGGQQWLNESGGIPITAGAEPAEGLEGLVAGEWVLAPRVPALSFTPKAKSGQPLYDGYLLGSRSLDEMLDTMSEDWLQWAREKAEDGGWTEDWAQG